MKNTTILTLLSALTLGACSAASMNEPIDNSSAAVITVVFDERPADTLYVLVSDSATIAAAESYVATHTGPRLVSGRIVKGAGWDTRYPFHFEPETVRLVDLAIELCDGAPMRTSQAVADFFEGSTGNADSPSAHWCPWSSSPIAVQRLGAAAH